MLGYLMYYFIQESRAGRNVVRLEPENRRALAEMISRGAEKVTDTVDQESTVSPASRFEGENLPRIQKTLFREMIGDPTQDFSVQGSFLNEVSGTTKQEKFEEIKRIIKQRGKPAGLEKCRDTLVFPTGNLDARLVFVGEAPGADEELQGEPFVGKAGELLTKMIFAMGIKREDVFICNVLLRRPSVGPVTNSPQVGNRPPTPAEMASDRAQLMTFIDLVRPEVIVCLGLTAVKGLLVMPDAVMSQVRGRWHEIKEPIQVPVLATYHPSYLLRNQAISEKRKVWEDLMMVMERLGMQVSDKQRAYFTQKQQG